jgi:hypothetical protein
MKLFRFAATAIVSGVVTLGFIGVSAPSAHAMDINWGYSVKLSKTK